MERRGPPEWANEVEGWPENLWAPSNNIFVLIERRLGRWRFVCYQHLKGWRTVRYYYSSRDPNFAYRIELRERDGTGKWRLWSTDPRFWTPMWLHAGLKLRPSK